MTQTYEIQQDILRLFQGKPTKILAQKEIDNLNLYKGLVINSMESLLTKIFSEIYMFYKQEWREITKDYLEHYPSKSAIYNLLCKDFPEFLKSSFFNDKYGSNNYFHEIALYKWLDLELYNSTAQQHLSNGFIQNYTLYESNFNIPLIINYLHSGQEIDKNDDIELEKNYIFIYRSLSETKTLVINKITKEFIEELEANKPLQAVRSLFIDRYQDQSTNIELEINTLIDYLKNMKILLI